jgi:hypothetical protein
LRTQSLRDDLALRFAKSFVMNDLRRQHTWSDASRKDISDVSGGPKPQTQVAIQVPQAAFRGILLDDPRGCLGKGRNIDMLVSQAYLEGVAGDRPDGGLQ